MKLNFQITQMLKDKIKKKNQLQKKTHKNLSQSS
jgi:hypothetical protein